MELDSLLGGGLVKRVVGFLTADASIPPGIEPGVVLNWPATPSLWFPTVPLSFPPK